MTLRTRLLIAQSPLAVALAAVAVLSVVTSTTLGRAGERILSDNYRSVLAAQRMKESIERLDSGALFVVIGERERGLALAPRASPRLRARAAGGGAEHHRAGRGRGRGGRSAPAWTDYQRDYDRFLAAPEEPAPAHSTWTRSSPASSG